MRRTLSPDLFTGLLSAVLAAGAVALTSRAGDVAILPVPLPTAAVVLMVGVAFFLAELFQLNVEFRRQAHTFTPAGVLLVLGVLALPPPVFVTTRLVASVMVFAWQRVAVDKTAYNCSAYAFEAAAAALLVHWLLVPTPHLDERTAMVLITVLAGVDQVTSALVLVMIRVHNGPLTRADVVRVLVPAFVLSLLSTMFAFAVVILVEQGILGSLVAITLVALFALAYRTYAAARQRHQSLTLVHEFVTGGVGAQTLEELAQELLARIRGQLRATSVLVTISETGWGHQEPSSTGRALVLALDEHDSLDTTHEAPDEQEVLAGRTPTPHEPLLATRTTKDPSARHWLDQHGFRDAIIVALPEASGLRGTLRVTDRLGETTSFTAEDLALLQTLTGHLAVALRSAWLVKKLGYDATHDALTGLTNRRGLHTDGQARLATAPVRPRALLLLDLDKFKEVNDSLGHHAGDQLLVEVGARLRAQLRHGDLLARIGGDEFAVLLEGVGSDEACLVAESLVASLAQPFTPVAGPSALGTLTLHSTVSIGIARFPDDGEDLSTLLRKADIAMYKAKVAGTGHHVYDDLDNADGAARLRMADELQGAITADQFVLHYQPKVDLGTDAVHAVEALVRWDHPTRGLLYPDAFIEVVEVSGLMRAMTRVVLQIALDQAARWSREGVSLTISVNLSASSLVDDALPDEVFAMLGTRGLPPSALQLEITEEFLMADRDRARRILTRLRDGGVAISIDDYGTGYSSLSYLRDLPVDELKLDKSFVLRMTDNPRAAALVASTISLAHSLGLRMVAEGVETPSAYAALTRLGCDQAQGYVVSRPLPAAELDRWLGDRTSTAHPARPATPLEPVGPHGVRAGFYGALED